MRFTALVTTIIGSIPFFLATPVAAFAADLTADTAKQILDKRWQSLRPVGFTERNVLFQSVRALGPNRFSVTAAVRDYGPGYPPNHFYGSTCVGHFDDAVFSFRFDGANWQADGAFTAASGKTLCQNNPAAGVSSQPLASLQGASAPAGQIAAGPAPVKSGGMVEGSYECWNFNQARAGLNFAVRSGGRYTDSEGTAGTFSLNAGNQQVLFKGGLLSVLAGDGFQAIYHEPKGTPTLSIRSVKSGAEVSFCELASR